MKLGYIGLGAMGLPMAVNLRAAGHDLVVHNRSRGKVDAFVAAGGTAATTPAELAGQVDVVMACLPIPQICEEVFLGADGVIEGAPDGQLWIDFSTNGADTARRIAAGAATKGIGFLDAPVSGGPHGAEAGTLAVMVGGAESDFERARPLLDVVGGNVRHFGAVGTGSVVKLVGQIMASATYAGIVEGYVAAMRHGIDPRAMYETLRTAIADSRAHDLIIGRSVLDRDFEPRFALDLLLKDLRLAVAMGREAGVRMLATNLVEQLYCEAQAKGYGAQDATAIIRPLEDLTGTEVRAAD